VILLKTDMACSRCPNNLLCMTGRKLKNAQYCRRCCAVTFKEDGRRFLCLLLREGVHSRLASENFHDDVSLRGRRLAYVNATLAYPRTEFDGCTRLRRKVKRHPRAKNVYRWVDCEHYFQALNGFDVKL
jgi:hypothetical protein